MKKGAVILLLLICLTMVTSVKAKSVSWDDIKSRYKEFIDNDNYTIIDDENKFEISLTNPKYGDYSILFNYDNNVISFNDSTDVSSMSDEDKYYHYSTNDYFIFSLLFAISDLYQIGDLEDNIELKPEDLGIIIDEEGMFEVNSDDINSPSIQIIKSFSIDLDKFSLAMQEYYDTLSSEKKDMYSNLVLFLKSFMNPMSEDILHEFSNNFSFDDLFNLETFENNTDDFGENNTETSTDIEETPKRIYTPNEIVQVPSTGSNAKLFIYGFIVSSIACGGVVYLLMIRKYN